MFNHSAVQECITFLNDIPRNVWYRDNLQKIVAGKTVLEIGCGAGILAAYALELGAKHYYGIDLRYNRVNFTNDLIKDLGYGDRATVWTANFCQFTANDIPNDIDILLCERTADQFQSNITILQFWQNANKIFSKKYISLPDEWGIDVEIYAGTISSLSELSPRVLVNDSSLPTGYNEFVKKSQMINPVFKQDGLIRFGPDTCNQPLEFVLDLRKYASATVLINDYISYRGHRCNSISATTDWPGPIQITVPEAGALIKFYWNQDLRHGTRYTKGYWTYECL